MEDEHWFHTLLRISSINYINYINYINCSDI